MAKTTRLRLTEVRVRTVTDDDAKHGRQLFDGLGSNGLYLHVTPGGAKCTVQQLMGPDAATGKSKRVRIGLGAWPRVPRARCVEAGSSRDRPAGAGARDALPRTTTRTEYMLSPTPQPTRNENVPTRSG